MLPPKLELAIGVMMVIGFIFCFLLWTQVIKLKPPEKEMEVNED